MLSQNSRAQSWLSIGGLLMMVTVTLPAPTSAEAAWCAMYRTGGSSCGFSSQAQCLASVSGAGGLCSQDSDAQSPVRTAPERRKATSKPKTKPAQKKTQAVRQQHSPAIPVAKPGPAPIPSTPSPAAATAPAQAATAPAHDYASARQLILSGQFEAGLAAMRALNFDDHPDIAAYVGFAHHKRGRIDQAKSWYDRALVADTNHKLTLSFYGMLRAEQGDLANARAYLIRIGKLCGGTECNEYQTLQGVISSKGR